MISGSRTRAGIVPDESDRGSHVRQQGAIDRHHHARSFEERLRCGPCRDGHRSRRVAGSCGVPSQSIITTLATPSSTPSDRRSQVGRQSTRVQTPQRSRRSPRSRCRRGEIAVRHRERSSEPRHTPAAHPTPRARARSAARCRRSDWRSVRRDLISHLSRAGD